MKKILVTGAAGFIGSNLVERLLKDGSHVLGIDNVVTGIDKNAKRLSKYKDFEFLKLDVADLGEEIIETLTSKNFDEIYHLACPTGVPNLITLAEEMLLTCSIGTRNILEIARRSNSKFLLSSSSEVYGEPLVSPQEESYTGNVDSIGIRSPYEEGKRFAESITTMYMRKYRLDTRIARIFNTYGSYMSEKDLRVIPRFFEQVKAGKPLTVHGKGGQKRTFCYVDDLIEGLILVMDRGVGGQVYNLGSDQEITILDLASLIRKVTGSKVSIKSVERPAHDHSARLPDLTKIKRLGWQQKTSLAEGLRKTFRETTLQLQNPVETL